MAKKKPEDKPEDINVENKKIEPKPILDVFGNIVRWVYE